MTNPIETKDGKTTIDNAKINSIAKRFLAALKAFLITAITPAKWDRLGLEKTWKYFLPLAAILILWFIHYATYWMAFGVLAITVVWLFRSRN